MVESSQDKALLVTGGTGYIGSHTIVELLETEGQCGFTKIVIVDNLANSSTKVLERIDQITKKGHMVVFEELDLREEEKLDNIFAKHGPFASVIHFAGLKAVGESCEKPLSYYDNNVIGTIALLKVMAKHGTENIVFSSSATLYGDSAVNAETNKIQPTNPYGQTKGMIEQILKDVAAANGASFSAICLRYFNPVGAHSSGLIGEDPQGIPNNLMPYIQRVAGGQLPHLNVLGTDYDTPDGTGVRDYIHIVDLASGHTAALAAQLKKDNPLRGYVPINLGTGNGVSVLEMVAAFEKASGKTIEKKMQPRRPGDVTKLLADPSKAKEVLNWTAKHSVEDMCRDSWNWVSKNPNGYK